jgi:hypothetical protein
MVKSNRFGEQWVSYKRNHTFGRSLSWKSYIRTRTGSVLILLETEHGMRVLVLSCKMIEGKRFASRNHAAPTRRIISQEHKLRLTRVMRVVCGDHGAIDLYDRWRLQLPIVPSVVAFLGTNGYYRCSQKTA